MAEQKTVKAPATSEATTVVPEATHPRGLQAGATVSGPLSTNAPRGVGEAAADEKAGEEGARALQDHVQNVVDRETEQGFRGRRVDPTPRENYTLAGVGKGLPTPETVVVTPKGA